MSTTDDQAAASSRHRHVVLTGRTGSGTTSALRAYAAERRGEGAEIWAADPKRIGLADLRGWPECKRFATSAQEIAELIEDAHTEMLRRFAQLESAEVQKDEIPSLVVVVDEILLAGMLIRNSWEHAGAADDHLRRPPAIGKLEELLALGLPAGVYLAMSGGPRDARDVMFPAAGDDVEMRHVDTDRTPVPAVVAKYQASDGSIPELAVPDLISDLTALLADATEARGQG
jgi:hypothetical protein